jgi:hypothetical protein
LDSYIKTSFFFAVKIFSEVCFDISQNSLRNEKN